MQKIAGAVCDNCTLNDRPFVPASGHGGLVAIVGEAPGETEVSMGRPFVGRSGQFLRQRLIEAGLDPDTCLITNACLCRPEDNRTPRSMEMWACRPRLMTELQDARFILTVGVAPLKAVLASQPVLSMMHGIPFRLQTGAILMPTYHPAAAMRDPRIKEQFVADIAKFVNKLVHEDYSARPIAEVI